MIRLRSAIGRTPLYGPRGLRWHRDRGRHGGLRPTPKAAQPRKPKVDWLKAEAGPFRRLGFGAHGNATYAVLDRVVYV